MVVAGILGLDGGGGGGIVSDVVVVVGMKGGMTEGSVVC